MAQGFSVLAVEERPTIGPSGQLKDVTVISIETDLGARGSLKIPTKEYESLEDQELGDRLVAKAMALDRALML